MNLAVIGTGYVGLVGAAVFSDWGNKVVGIDLDINKINKIKNGEMPIFEPGLKEIVLKNIQNRNLSFTTSLSEGIKNADIIFICVGTPQSSTGEADLSAVYKVAEELANNITSYKVVVTKSTVPVGTNYKVKEIISKKVSNSLFDVVSNPEFLREGYSVDDMQNPDRTIVGVESKKSKDLMSKLYAHLKTKVLFTDINSAEMIKYASNAFLATKISFINEIAQLCEKVGGDVKLVSEGMGLDSRIGNKFLNAGIGYGGSCFPKDVAALYNTAYKNDYEFSILKSVISVNKEQKDHFIKKITNLFGTNLDNKRFAVLGTAFKENTDDIRESVSIKIIKTLRGLGATISVYDPEALDNAREQLGENSISYMANPYNTLKNADALLILTEWKEFKDLDFDKVKEILKGLNIFDGRNLLLDKNLTEKGFNYYNIGIKKSDIN